MGDISEPKHTHIDRITKYTNQTHNSLSLSLSLHSIDELMQRCEEDDTMHCHGPVNNSILNSPCNICHHHHEQENLLFTDRLVVLLIFNSHAYSINYSSSQ